MEYEEEVNPCFYCGARATTVDHVIPKSVLRTIDAIEDPELSNEMRRKRRLTVPACKECNSLLGATVQETLEERKRFLKQKLKKRYKRLLEMPDWSEKELKDMGEGLEQHIRASQEKKDWIIQRLRW